ncbi:hypothetical protein E2C01_098547 [Portunus trituberculatus]|uniref:Uncharacterized protein n=1 Tax=Portunus trituberculatus TaxID=210409 RepID=A0A5B7KCD5_PORTR|nr:hypothetical protein [Portunus trituberculatus]
MNKRMFYRSSTLTPSYRSGSNDDDASLEDTSDSSYKTDEPESNDDDSDSDEVSDNTDDPT